MTLWERTNIFSNDELIQLYDEASELDRTGILPMTAYLRRLAQETFGSATNHNMLLVSHSIYKRIAQTCITEHTSCLPQPHEY